MNPLPAVPAAHRSWSSPCLAVLLVLSLACGAGEEPAAVDDVAAPPPCDFTAGGGVDLGCPAPPDTFDTTALSGTANGSNWDAWAWSSFAAYNWPALVSSDGAVYPTGYVRGVPDTMKGFTTASSDDVAVWETFKEKRELFNDLATAGAWQQLTFDPTYAPNSGQFPGGQIEACAGVGEELLARVRERPRVFAQLGKQSPSIDGDSSTDETAEVASPAQESQDALCAGYTASTDPTLDDCHMNFQPPPGGTPTSEYSAVDDNFRPAVGPRVFKGEPSAEGFVYYEVKLNYDYYAYLAANGLNDYDTAVAKAKAAQIHLPFRTSAMAKLGGDNAAAVVGYDATATAGCYGKKLSGCAQSGVGPEVLPGVGSVQVKSAWLPAGLLDGEASDYHTTYAVYYEDSPDQPNGLCYKVQQFGLIGLHIIQRVHGGATTAAEDETIGGTFVFATWEHDSVAGGAGYTYVNYLADQALDQTDPSPFPNTAEGLQVARLQGYPLATTTAVNQAVAPLLADSVWKNYRLIGTQFQATSSESDSLALGQPYYLANLVIETNRGLQQFQGRPPAVQVIDHYMKQIPPVAGVTPHFAPAANNMAFAGSEGAAGFDMGGCMGCHGVAQAQGFAFSFVLQDGKFGTKPDTATSVAIPPKAPQNPAG